ncbi:MAG: GNAT family N-acetyltransferase [Hyphomicrobium sp.]
MSEPIAICRYLDVSPTPELANEIDAIFFQSSNTTSFESDATRSAFRERWLGRYLTHDPQFAYLARSGEGTVVGYLVGSVDDPAETTRFADIGYFSSLRPLTKRFPAHLHINVDAHHRGRGLGGRLISRFAADAAAVGVPGIHVVTDAEARNVGFYNRNGFAEVGRAGAGGKLVFLARTL